MNKKSCDTKTSHEKLPSNPQMLIRALVLLVLSSGCAMQIPATKPTVKSVISKPDIPTGLNVRYSYRLKGKNVKLDSDTDINQDIPSVTTQSLKIIYTEDTATKMVIFGTHSDSHLDLKENLSTQPINTDRANCTSEPISHFYPVEKGFGNMKEYYNVEILLSLLKRYFPAHGILTDESVLRTNLETGRLESTSISLSGWGNSIDTIIGPLKIARNPDGVRISTELLNCKRQRREKATDIAAKVRGKLAKGSKAGNRR